MNREKSSVGRLCLVIAIMFVVLVTVSCSVAKNNESDTKEFVINEENGTQTLTKSVKTVDKQRKSQDEKEIGLSDFDLDQSDADVFSVVNVAVGEDAFFFMEVKTQPDSFLTVSHGDTTEQAKVGENGKLIFTSLFVPEDTYTLVGTTPQGEEIGRVTLKYKD